MKTTMSFVCGSSEKPLIYRTIGDAFDDAVEQWGDREAIVVRHQGIRWTYRQLGEAIDAFAAGLHRQRVQTGSAQAPKPKPQKSRR